MKTTEVIKRPIMTEKSIVLKEQGTYVFAVDRAANKLDIKNSVEKLYGVKVSSVRTVTTIGKVKRFGQAYGKTKAVKKAYVKLANGGKIELFDGV